MGMIIPCSLQNTKKTFIILILYNKLSLRMTIARIIFRVFSASVAKK